jgi:hypothetical protein
LRRQLNALKREQFPWMLDVKNAPQMAIMHLGQAFKNFWLCAKCGWISSLVGSIFRS